MKNKKQRGEENEKQCLPLSEYLSLLHSLSQSIQSIASNATTISAHETNTQAKTIALLRIYY